MLTGQVTLRAPVSTFYLGHAGGHAVEVLCHLAPLAEAVRVRQQQQAAVLQLRELLGHHLWERRCLGSGSVGSDGDGGE